MAEWNPKAIDAEAHTDEQAIAEVARELTLRAAVYGKMIESGKLTLERATAQQGALKKAWLLLKNRSTVSEEDKAQILRGVELLNATQKLGPNPLGVIQRIVERGGLPRLAAAYKLLDMLEAGTDLSQIVEVAKTFPGAKITGVNEPTGLAEAA